MTYRVAEIFAGLEGEGHMETPRVSHSDASCLFKTCSTCRIHKPVTDFWQSKTKRDGYMYQCKACRGATMRIRDQRPEVLAARREARRQRDDDARKQAAAKTRAYFNAQPEQRKEKKRAEALTEKGRAREALRYAVRHGRIIKPNNCEKCGKSVSGHSELHGHHVNYSKPLEVQWLCPRCHGQTRWKETQ